MLWFNVRESTIVSAKYFVEKHDISINSRIESIVQVTSYRLTI